MAARAPPQDGGQGFPLPSQMGPSLLSMVRRGALAWRMRSRPAGRAAAGCPVGGAAAGLPLPLAPVRQPVLGGGLAAAMFRKARRVNVRKRNESEEEDEERDEEPHEPVMAVADGSGGSPPVPAPSLGPGPSPVAAPLLPLPPGCVPLAATGFNCAAGSFGLGLGLAAGPGPLAPPALPPPPAPAQPPPQQQGNGLPGAARAKEKRRGRENKEARGSLLSFRDEEEGEWRGWGAMFDNRERPRGGKGEQAVPLTCVGQGVVPLVFCAGGGLDSTTEPNRGLYH